MRQTIDRHGIWAAVLIGLILVLTLMGVTVVSKHEHFAKGLLGGRGDRLGERPLPPFLVLPLQDPYQLDLRSHA